MKRPKKVISCWLYPYEMEMNSCSLLPLILFMLLKHNKKVYSKTKKKVLSHKYVCVCYGVNTVLYI